MTIPDLSRRGRLLDLLDQAEDDGSGPADIYICPPDVREASDDDSGDDDGSGLVDNLNSNLLQVEAEIVQYGDDSDEEEATPAAAREGKWGKREVVSCLKPRAGRCPYAQKDFSAMTAVQIFEFFFDEEFFGHLMTEVRRYAQWSGKNILPFPTVEELKAVIAILFFSGYHPVPARRHYWASDPDLHVEFVSRVMSRNRFEAILSVLHFADNQRLDPGDKMAKLRPLIDIMKRKFVAAFQRPEPETQLDVDESMIPYYGRHGCKQFLRGKPIRFGFKAWCLNSPDGYLLAFDIYQGAGGIVTRPEYVAAFGKCGAVVKSLVDELPKEIRQDSLHVFTDNLFTSLPLAGALKDEGIGLTGTIRQNRLKGCPLRSVNAMKKAERGEMSIAVETTIGVNLARWKDNSVVTGASTVHGSKPTSDVQRWSQKDKKRVLVRQPSLIKEYNQGMGGTDRMDENIGCYRIAIRQRKFWWSIFIWIIGAAMQNAWLLHRRHHPGESQLDFIRTVVRYYLADSVKPPSGRPSSASAPIRVPIEIRFDRVNHLIVPLAKQGLCANKPGCKSHPKTGCNKCQVHLCVACFLAFHSA